MHGDPEGVGIGVGSGVGTALVTALVTALAILGKSNNPDSLASAATT